MLILGPALALVLGGLLYAATIFRHPWLAVGIIVLSLPFHQHPRSIGGVEISGTEAAILISAATLLARAIAERTGRLPATLHRFPSSAADWGAAGMLLAGLLSLTVSEYPKQSLRELRWLLVEPIMVFYIARATLAGRGQVGMVLFAIVGAGAAAAGLSLLQLAVDGQLSDLAARGSAPYSSPNHLGLLLGRAAAVGMAMVALAAWPPLTGNGDGSARDREALPARQTWLVAGATTLILLALARSLSIGAWVGTASAALVIAALRGRRWLLGIALGLLLVAMAAALVLPGERIRSRLDPVSGTGLSRLQIWEASLQMIADHPVLGVGLDNFLYAYRQDYMLTEAWREPNISHPHNWVLHTWLQLGLLGLIATVGLLAWAGWRAASLLRAPTSPLDPTLGAATFAFLTDVLVHGSFDNSYFLVDLAILWWVLLALLHPSVSHGSPYNSLSAPIPADPR